MMYKLSDLNPQTRPVELTIENIDNLISAYKYLLEKHPDIKLYDYRASRRIVSLSYSKDLEIIECVNFE